MIRSKVMGAARRWGAGAYFAVLACGGGSGATATGSDPAPATATTTATVGMTQGTGFEATTEGATTGDATSEGTTTEGATTSDETTSDGSTTAATTGGELLEACPDVGLGIQAAIVNDPEIDEASGMIASRDQADILWVHNDSGDSPRIFAISGVSGETRGIFNIATPGGKAVDWEDLAAGPGGPGAGPGTWLYIGDIGDNPRTRPSITVYRIREPIVANAREPEVLVSEVESIELTYPDGSHDAETLLVDPNDGELVIVTKGSETGVYRLPGPIAAGTYELEKVTPQAMPLTVTTAGDVSPLGDFVIVRTYLEARLWLRQPGTSLAAAFDHEPCTVPLAIELQGETLAIASDGRGYFTLSEKVGQPLWRFRFLP